MALPEGLGMFEDYACPYDSRLDDYTLCRPLYSGPYH